MMICARPAPRGGRPAAGRGPAVRPDFVLTGTPPHLTREEATERIVARRRQGHGQRLQKDELRRGGSLARLQAREGRAARRAGARRSGTGGSFWTQRLGSTCGAGHGRHVDHREGALCHMFYAPRRLGALALALAVPAGAAAKPKEAEAHGHGHSVNALPSTTPRNLNRKCGKSHSATKIRKRSTSRPTKNRVRTVTTYCSGGTRTSSTSSGSPRSSTSRGRRSRPGARARVRREVLPAPLLHTTTANPSTRHRLDRRLRRRDPLQDCARQAPRRGRRHQRRLRVQGHARDQLGRQLPRRAEPARLLPALDAGNGSFYDCARPVAIGYDAVTIGNHDTTSGRRAWRSSSRSRPRACRSFGEHRLHREPLLEALRDKAASPTRPWSRNGGSISASSASPRRRCRASPRRAR